MASKFEQLISELAQEHQRVVRPEAQAMSQRSSTPFGHASAADFEAFGGFSLRFGLRLGSDLSGSWQEEHQKIFQELSAKTEAPCVDVEPLELPGALSKLRRPSHTLPGHGSALESISFHGNSR